MARKTDGEKIDDLMERVAKIGTALDQRSAQFIDADERLRTEVTGLRDDLRRMTERNAALESRLAVVEQRCAALEKQTDRTSQVWLALIVAGVGLVVSLVKK